MYKIGIDIGGTFTDAVLFDEQGEIKVFKTPTTPEDFTSGFMNCLKESATSVGLELQEFLGNTDVIAHGTTVTTNAVLTTSGAKVGTITTKGFRDILEVRRGIRPDPYYYPTSPAPVLSPRYLRQEVNERILSSGEVLTPLNEDDVRNAIRKFKEEGVEAVAVCLLFSFLNPVHEKRIGEIISEEYAGVYTALSFEVLPQLREYERTSTTVLDAYVGPILSKYVTRLQERLKESGFRGDLLIMQSNGGVQKWDVALKHAVGAINSGPAAGFPCSLNFAEMLDVQDILLTDMGGTSFDVGLIKGRTIKTTTGAWVAKQRNALPMVDVLAIGAGGGSIGWIDPVGILRVGPQSAGAVPGPACYGMGGEETTVTDANLILGYISPDYFLGGKMKVEVDAANVALERLGVKLGMNITETADAMFNIVNENMANAITLACVQTGYDPRDFLLVVGGGAGATHAVRIAQKLSISRIFIPKQAPMYCALGLVLSDLKHDYVRSYFTRLRQADFNEINRLYDEIEREGRGTLKSEGISEQNITFQKSADMRYVGQFKEIEIDLPGKSFTAQDVGSIEKLFSQKHEQLFTYSDPDRELEMLTLKGTALGKVPRLSLKEKPRKGEDPGQALKSQRQVFFSEGRKFLKASIYDGDLLQPGNIIEGPAVIEETAMTVVIPPRIEFHIDQYGNYSALL